MISRAEWGAVWGIIVVRGAQVGGMALLALAGCWFVLPVGWWIWVAVVGGVTVTVGLSLYFRAVFDPRTRWGIIVPSPPGLLPSPLTPLPQAGEGKRVLLTFDDGPFLETTGAILDVLREYGVTAAFFVVGEQVRLYPELVRRMVDEGHVVGLHGLRHEAMVLKSARVIRAELAEAEGILTEVVGDQWSVVGGRWFRPPHGFTTPTLCRVLSEMGWQRVGWSVDSRDYDPLSAGEIVDRVLGAVSPGAVVLLHEGPGHEATVAALPGILDGVGKIGAG